MRGSKHKQVAIPWIHNDERVSAIQISFTIRVLIFRPFQRERLRVFSQGTPSPSLADTICRAAAQRSREAQLLKRSTFSLTPRPSTLAPPKIDPIFDTVLSETEHV